MDLYGNTVKPRSRAIFCASSSLPVRRGCSSFVVHRRRISSSSSNSTVSSNVFGFRVQIISCASPSLPFPFFIARRRSSIVVVVVGIQLDGIAARLPFSPLTCTVTG
jgi:hypothetical protein